MIATLLIAGAGAAFAAGEPPAPSKEMRNKMAALHEKMAACLRSDTAFSECRGEMHKNCQDTMGEQGCPMMGMGMHDRMRGKPPSNNPDAK
jgi:hypothetical protein